MRILYVEDGDMQCVDRKENNTESFVECCVGTLADEGTKFLRS